MVRVILLVLMLLAVYASALDRLWDTRYTFGPEFMVQDRFTVGAGFYTAYIEDGTLPINAQVAINDYWEFGGKIFSTTNDKLETINTFADIGAKYRIREYGTLEADFLLGLNNSEGGGLVISYAQLQKLSKNFSNLIEGRIGFFDAVAGKDGYAKLGIGLTPELRLGNSVRAMMGVEGSGSFGNLTDDFMIDLVPRIEVGLLPNLRVLGELAIGIMQEKNNNNVRTGFYITCDL